MFIVSSFISVLKATPAAHVINEDRREIANARLGVLHQLLQSVASAYGQAAASGIFVNSTDFEAMFFGISPNCLELIFC